MNTTFRVDVIEKYLSGITTDSFHRYTSWDHCYNAFSDGHYTDALPLHLGFYLASWGMYRGSAGLLQKNHLIHQGAIDIILSPKFNDLRCSLSKEVTRHTIDLTLELKGSLSRYYTGIFFTRGTKTKPISDTDTLLSKVMLGTMACVPAYDRYFLAGLSEEGLKHTKFDSDSLNELFDFSIVHKERIGEAQKLVQGKTKAHYPLMKVLDMYFWQIGFDVQP
jgi:hypothetical protein